MVMEGELVAPEDCLDCDDVCAGLARGAPVFKSHCLSFALGLWRGEAPCCEDHETWFKASGYTGAHRG